METRTTAASCRHGIENPGRACGVCRGSWDGVVRSKVTGAVLSGPDLIAWFVPTASPAQRRGWVDFIGVRQSDGMPRAGAVPVPADHHVRAWRAVRAGRLEAGSFRVEVLPSLGPPAWYRRSVAGTVPVGAAVDWAGLDWASVMELHAADLLASLEPSGTVEVVPIPARSISSAEASSIYSGAAMASLWDGGDRLREWRKLTGRYEGAEVLS